MRRVLLIAALAFLLNATAAPASQFEPTGKRVRAAIVGGRNANPGAWQGTVALLRSGIPANYRAHFCGGSLVAQQVVLTAAHCVITRTAGALEVGVGYALDRTMVRYAVTAIRVHPGYRRAVLGYHDLALLTLATAVPRTPMALAGPTEDNNGQPASIAGWGNVAGGGAHLYPIVLQSGDFVIGGGACAYQSFGFDPALVLCAGANGMSVMSACDGDSGGPMVSYGKLVGVVSVGIGSCRAQSYYARVSAERQWLEPTIAAAGRASTGRGAATHARVTAAARPLV